MLELEARKQIEKTIRTLGMSFVLKELIKQTQNAKSETHEGYLTVLEKNLEDTLDEYEKRNEIKYNNVCYKCKKPIAAWFRGTGMKCSKCSNMAR